MKFLECAFRIEHNKDSTIFFVQAKNQVLHQLVHDHPNIEALLLPAISILSPHIPLSPGEDPQVEIWLKFPFCLM